MKNPPYIITNFQLQNNKSQHCNFIQAPNFIKKTLTHNVSICSAIRSVLSTLKISIPIQHNNWKQLVCLKKKRLYFHSTHIQVIQFSVNVGSVRELVSGD